MPSNQVNVWETNILEGTPVAHAHRVNSVLEVPLLIANVTSISRKVWPLDSDTATLEDTVTPAATMFDTLQSWSKDGIGYNFRDILPGSAFPDGDTEYDVEYTFVIDPVASGPIKIKGKITTVNVRSD